RHHQRIGQGDHQWEPGRHLGRHADRQRRYVAVQRRGPGRHRHRNQRHRIVVYAGGGEHMVSALARRDSLTWLSPSPTWGDVVDLAAPDQRKDFARPAILRFAHDRFMEELTGALAYQPEKLGEWRAQPETWEKPMHTPPSA